MDIEHLIDTWRGPLVGLFAGWGASWADASELAHISEYTQLLQYVSSVDGTAVWHNNHELEPEEASRV